MQPTPWNVRIGINPISWSNDDLPELGGETPLETALREGAAIGYQGFELGNKFPQAPEALAAKLAEFGVACVSGWYSGRLAEGPLDDEIANCHAHMHKLQHNGCKVVVYGEVAGSIQGRIDTPLARRPRFTNEAQWRAYGQRLNAFGEHLQAAYGLTLAYHHHMGAYVESPEDVAQLMAVTQAPQVGLLFDTGHAFYGGASDPAALLRQHVSRVVHVHCKDVRPQVIAQARNEGWSFLTGVLNGTFTVPGDGVIDFDAVLQTLHAAGYQGWLVVEAEQDPAVAPSEPYARKGYETLRRCIATATASGVTG
ncbi:myo-inosose-2 dehydratase [Ideonella azotifigens]|uniref:Myo-inosose-2 dehydratase n=1 Tax=Ideonella azotifigens TaxID=513160 RepID=A0ABP3VF16_9BURK|nr:myo-inosose-2 dehydratase [Ideonella azotifigens]MCD2342299.1 myo-inosose-2 dehydratase [Ideonella azotifigens]